MGIVVRHACCPAICEHAAERKQSYIDVARMRCSQARVELSNAMLHSARCLIEKAAMSGSYASFPRYVGEGRDGGVVAIGTLTLASPPSPLPPRFALPPWPGEGVDQ